MCRPPMRTACRMPPSAPAIVAGDSRSSDRPSPAAQDVAGGADSEAMVGARTFADVPGASSAPRVFQLHPFGRNRDNVDLARRSGGARLDAPRWIPCLRGQCARCSSADHARRSAAPADARAASRPGYSGLGGERASRLLVRSRSAEARIPPGCPPPASGRAPRRRGRGASSTRGSVRGGARRVSHVVGAHHTLDARQLPTPRA